MFPRVFLVFILSVFLLQLSNFSFAFPTSGDDPMPPWAPNQPQKPIIEPPKTAPTPSTPGPIPTPPTPGGFKNLCSNALHAVGRFFQAGYLKVQNISGKVLIAGIVAIPVGGTIYYFYNAQAVGNIVIPDDDSNNTGPVNSNTPH